MALVLEIEFLSGVSFAAVGPDSDRPDWPPQPDRVFSALVSAWAARGEDEDERQALEWLEKQSPPLVDASEAEARTAAVVFVPPNDPRSDRKTTAIQVIPDRRRRQPRRFPSARPHHAVMRLCWHVAQVQISTLSALDAIARDVAYVGHSSSLTRCQFLHLGDAPGPMSGSACAHRRVYPGRFAELRRDFKAGRRPRPGDPVMPTGQPPEAQHNVFCDRWLILEHIQGVMPDVRAAALVAKTIRDTILSGYKRSGLGAEIPETVSGHTPDGDPTSRPHMAVVPLPFVGFPRADGHVMGFAVVVPQPGELLDDADFRRALRAVAPMDEEQGRRVMTVKTPEGTPRDRAFSIQLSPTFEPPVNRRSLDPRLYLRPSRAFATVTPIVLDRHLKGKGRDREEEIREQLVQACHNIGVPEPAVISADKHPTIEGAASAHPSGNAPNWTRWRLPGPLASRQLTHALLRFPVDVPGPLILGAGRYFGLGLCRTLIS